MGVLIAIACDGCDYVQDLHASSYNYELSEEDMLPIETRLAWCHECGAVSEVEFLPDLAETEKQIQRLESEDPELMATLEAEGRFAEDEIEFQTLIRDWLRQRESPPRCLACGSTRIEEPWALNDSRDQEDTGVLTYPHPGCSGALSVKGMTVQPAGGFPRTYDPEGELLED